MASIAIPPIEGENLGKRHQSFNNIVNNAIKSITKFEDVRDLEENSDIVKLYKIEIAAYFKNVDYILEILKSEDILLVSRAIKRSTWLITDEQYSHIINPNYLNETLNLQMMPISYSKLLLSVRLNLKDEKRAEDFFNYYKLKNLSFALKWLPKCSISFIEQKVGDYYSEIKEDLFKKLCERSFSILKIFNAKCSSTYTKCSYVKSATFLIQNNVQEYLDVFESLSPFYPRLGPKNTELVMKVCPERIIKKFDIYSECIDLPTFVKNMDKNKIKEFLSNAKNDKKLKRWFRFENIKHFAKVMPQEGKFEFLKQIFIDRTDEDLSERDLEMYCDSAPVLQCAMKMSNNTFSKSKSNIYKWYKYATFDVAFPEMQKMIRTESSSDERASMLLVMVAAARQSAKNVETVLKFFRERHMNEPFKFKVHVVNNIISTKAPYRFGETSWKILDEIFHSMNVYTESDSNDSNCVECIVLYKLMHNEPIPEIIKKKFDRFSILESHNNKLNSEEKNKILEFLCLQSKLNKPTIENEGDFISVISILEDILKLLDISNKDLREFPDVLNKIKYLIKLSNEKSWSFDLQNIKKWRKYFFEESFILGDSEDTCINALKHDPQLFVRYKNEVEKIQYNDSVSLLRFLRKLKIYFPDSLCQNWIQTYETRLEQRGSQNAVIRGLCVLLPQKELTELIKKYAPKDNKIVWSEADEIQLNIQKQLAQKMHIARPKPQPDMVLLYAKGDYLQFALPSLHAIFYGLSSVNSKDHIPKLLDAPVSVQKHGIRIATSKFNPEELQEIFENIWKSTKNTSIRFVIFQLAFNMLCKEKSPETVEALWLVVEKFIENLSENDNKSIFGALGEVEEVPAAIRPKFCIKSYTFLKTLPAKLECENLVYKLAEYTTNIMQSIDINFVKNILLEYIDEVFLQNKLTSDWKSGYKSIVAAYLICVNDEAEFKRRSDEILQPILRHCFEMWSKIHDDSYIAKDYFHGLISNFNYIYERKFVESDILVPVELYATVLREFERQLSPVENYRLLTTLRLRHSFFQCLRDIKPKLTIVKPEKGDCSEDKNPWQIMCSEVAAPHADKIIEILKVDLTTYFPSIATTFAYTLYDFISDMSFDMTVRYNLYDKLLGDEEFVSGYFVTIILLNTIVYDDKYKENQKKTLKKIVSHSSTEVKLLYYDKFSR